MRIETFFAFVGVNAVASESGSPYYAEQQLRENEHRNRDGQWSYMVGADGKQFIPRDQAQVGMAADHHHWQPHGAVPLSLSESRMHTQVNEPGAERDGGAPNEQYSTCGDYNEGQEAQTCSCYKGRCVMVPKKRISGPCQR